MSSVISSRNTIATIVASINILHLFYHILWEISTFWKTLYSLIQLIVTINHSFIHSFIHFSIHLFIYFIIMLNPVPFFNGSAVNVLFLSFQVLLLECPISLRCLMLYINVQQHHKAISAACGVQQSVMNRLSCICQKFQFCKRHCIARLTPIFRNPIKYWYINSIGLFWGV